MVNLKRGGSKKENEKTRGGELIYCEKCSEEDKKWIESNV